MPKKTPARPAPSREITIVKERTRIGIRPAFMIASQIIKGFQRFYLINLRGTRKIIVREYDTKTGEWTVRGPLVEGERQTSLAERTALRKRILPEGE